MNAARAILIFGCSLALAGCDSAPISEAKSRVARQLKDPDSAKFEDVQVCSHNKDIVMGSVNAKNGFGAYTGYRSFFSKGHQTVFSDDIDLDTWGEWNVQCFGPDVVEETNRVVDEARRMIDEAAERPAADR